MASSLHRIPLSAFLILIVGIFVTPACRAQDHLIETINPGIKLGYIFGSTGGFTWGAELSYSRFVDFAFVGGLVSVDFSKRYTRFHLAGQITASGSVGGSIGPTIAIDRGKTKLGFTGTLFVGLFAMPYYSITILPKSQDLNEAGVFVKYPIFLEGSYDTFKDL